MAGREGGRAVDRSVITEPLVVIFSPRPRLRCMNASSCERIVGGKHHHTIEDGRPSRAVCDRGLPEAVRLEIIRIMKWAHYLRLSIDRVDRTLRWPARLHQIIFFLVVTSRPIRGVPKRSTWCDNKRIDRRLKSYSLSRVGIERTMSERAGWLRLNTIGIASGSLYEAD